MTRAPTPIKRAIPLLPDGLAVGAGLIIVVAINIHLFPTSQRKIEAIRATIITKTIMLDRPAIAKIPSTERIHKRSSTEATA